MIWPLEMVPWSMREMDTVRNGVDRHTCYPLQLVEYVPWFIIKQTQTETDMTDPPTVLLKNGSVAHNQMNVDRLRKLSATFLENVWPKQLAWTTLAKMERNRSTHHVPKARKLINCPCIAIWQHACKESYSGNG